MPHVLQAVIGNRFFTRMKRMKDRNLLEFIAATGYQAIAHSAT